MPKTPAKAPLDKYSLYSRAVQQPDVDVRFLRELYRELKGKTPKVLREDFCGTFSVCCEWVKLGLCLQLDCVHTSIPAVSEWGLLILALLLFIGAKLGFGRFSAHATGGV